MKQFIAVIDQGTSSTRCVVFDQQMDAITIAQQEFTQHFPQSGWVEHDPLDLLNSSVECLQEAIKKAQINASHLASIGITNQRETIVVWDKKTGQPIHNAIVWQDRRTADYCQALKDQGLENLVSAKTGLLLDPYFSASKVRWILDHVDGAQQRAEQGELLLGTVDSWLIWHLTNGQEHATDATNASRTLLYNIHDDQWDEELLALFKIPACLLPTVKDCADDFGSTDPALLGSAVPIGGVAGDQQAALMGQACFEPGMLKSTYGTGCFAMLNTGTQAVQSQHRLLTTTAYRLKGKTCYALEGSIFIAGAAVQWLRDGLKIIDTAADTQPLAEQADDSHHVYMVPAFVGLGAPHWDANIRGCITGITLNTGPEDLARATLEAVGYQTKDLLTAMQQDWSANRQTVLRVDGGMTASDWTMQFLADILNCPVDRPKYLETTALGAAYLAGLQAGLYPEPEAFTKHWALERRFDPQMDQQQRQTRYAGWQAALKQAKG